MIINIHDYKVVINIHKVIIQDNVKSTFLRLNTAIKSSLISEGVRRFESIYNLVREDNLTI
jgi:hypothetical protein